MEKRDFERVLKAGEGTSVEFKRCGGQAEKDTFETVCSFANHSGGTIFLGVENNGSVSGVSSEAALDIQRNILNVVNNPNSFRPAVTLEFDTFEHNGKTVIRVWVPQDAFVHSFKGKIYDRVVDSDIELRLDSQISALYLRKQSSYTEQKIFPYVTKDDLELDLLEEVRKRAIKKRNDHPWQDLDDEGLLASAGLFAKSYETGEEGFNLAAILLLGKDEVIASILPAYKTDAILRVGDKDRYDDRLTIKCNLIKAFPILEDFCKRHLKDKFYLEGSQTVSPRDIIVRELVSNTLIHREYSSPFPAKIIISDGEIITENGSKAVFDGPLDLLSFCPMPKNPITGNFFNNIGLADELGSGSRNLLKYARVYSGGTPLLIDGNVFRASVPVAEHAEKLFVSPEVSELVMTEINNKGYVTTVDIRDGLKIEHKAAQRELAKLVTNGVISPIGNTKGRRYVRAE